MYLVYSLLLSLLINKNTILVIKLLLESLESVFYYFPPDLLENIFGTIPVRELSQASISI